MPDAADTAASDRKSMATARPYSANGRATTRLSAIEAGHIHVSSKEAPTMAPTAWLTRIGSIATASDTSTFAV